MKSHFTHILLCLCSLSFGQTKLKVIKANTQNVSIRDGNVFEKDGWSLSPQAKPDVYTCYRTRNAKWVVFYTDLDSIKFNVKPGCSYDFVILLGGKDSCFTRIQSAIPPESKVKIQNSSDTIPFTLSAFNAICVKAILNKRDTVNLHLDLGSSEFRLTKEGILKNTKLLPNQTEVLSGKEKADYSRMEKVFQLQMGNLVFSQPDVRVTGFTSQGMDGRFGWNLFEGKVLEIDYDKNILVIHSQLPKIKKGFVKSKLEFQRSFVCISGTFVVNSKSLSAPFLIDTGSDLAIVLDSGWVNKQGFPKDLNVLKTTTFKDPRGKTYENKVVLAPQFALNGFEIKNVPTCVLGSGNPLGFELNILGNDVLKRFNMFADFKNDCIYLKPNALYGVAYL